MKKIVFFAFALLISLVSIAQNKTITLKVPQSSGMAGTPSSVLPGQSLVYNGNAWVGVTQYSATNNLGGNYTAGAPYVIPTLTGIVNVYVFTVANAINYITLPAPSSTTNGRTIVLKPSYATTGTTFRLIGYVDGNATQFTSGTPYTPNNGGVEFNITLVCDGTSWWITSTR